MPKQPDLLRKPAQVRRRGRPHGKVPFHNDKGRFEVVLFWVLAKSFNLDHQRASSLAVVLISARTSIAGETVRSHLARIKFDARVASSRPLNLASKAKRAQASLKGDAESEKWAASSYFAVSHLISAFVANDDRTMRWAVQGLLGLGWSEVLASITTGFVDATAIMPPDRSKGAKASVERYFRPTAVETRGYLLVPSSLRDPDLRPAQKR